MVPEHCDERALAAEARQVADLGPKGFATQGKEANILLYFILFFIFTLLYFTILYWFCHTLT